MSKRYVPFWRPGRRKKQAGRGARPRAKPSPLERKAEKIVLDKMNDDPKWAWHVALQMLGIPDVPKDDIERARRRIVAVHMKKDPAFGTRIAERRLARQSQAAMEHEIDRMITEETLKRLKTDPDVLSAAVARKADVIVEAVRSGRSVPEVLASLQLEADKVQRFNDS